MADLAFHVERGAGLRRLRVRRIEAQVMPARGADARAFEDRRLAVRAGARGTRRARAGVAHETSSRSALSALPLDFGASLSLQRSEEHTSEFQSLMRISYAVVCLK